MYLVFYQTDYKPRSAIAKADKIEFHDECISFSSILYFQQNLLQIDINLPIKTLWKLLIGSSLGFEP